MSLTDIKALLHWSGEKEEDTRHIYSHLLTCRTVHVSKSTCIVHELQRSSVVRNHGLDLYHFWFDDSFIVVFCTYFYLNVTVVLCHDCHFLCRGFHSHLRSVVSPSPSWYVARMASIGGEKCTSFHFPTSVHDRCHLDICSTLYFGICNSINTL